MRYCQPRKLLAILALVAIFGPHRIGITAYFGQNIWGDTRQSSTGFVDLEAEAGHVYQIRAESGDEGAVNAWIEDVTGD